MYNFHNRNNADFFPHDSWFIRIKNDSYQRISVNSPISKSFARIQK